MKTKFRLAADWDEKIMDRHKGEIIGQIHYQPHSGDITILNDFDNLSALERCDVLQDAIGLLQREYNRAHGEFLNRRVAKS